MFRSGKSPVLDLANPEGVSNATQRATLDLCRRPRPSALGRVRFIRLYSGTHLGDDWDGAHNDLTGSHNKMAAKTDKPISGLLKDLRARGVSDSTLVIWGSEFGRTPLAEGRNGRDHHPYAFGMWFTGAGVKGGRVLGATDELGLRPIESPLVSHDVNVTCASPTCTARTSSLDSC